MGFWIALSVLVHIRKLLWTKVCSDLFLLCNTSAYLCPVISLLNGNQAPIKTEIQLADILYSEQLPSHISQP